MKKIILFLLLCTPFFGFAQQKISVKKTPPMETWEVVGKDSVKLFYGLSPLKITKMSGSRIKAFLEKHKIKTSDFFTALIKAENYLLQEKIKRDSIELIQIYDRIEKKLGMKKNGSKSPT